MPSSPNMFQKASQPETWQELKSHTLVLYISAHLISHIQLSHQLASFDGIGCHLAIHVEVLLPSAAPSHEHRNALTVSSVTEFLLFTASFKHNCFISSALALAVVPCESPSFIY